MEEIELLYLIYRAQKKGEELYLANLSEKTGMHIKQLMDLELKWKAEGIAVREFAPVQHMKLPCFRLTDKGRQMVEEEMAKRGFEDENCRGPGELPQFAVALRKDEWEYILDLISGDMSNGRFPRQSGVNPLALFDYIVDEIPKEVGNDNQG